MAENRIFHVPGFPESPEIGDRRAKSIEGKPLLRASNLSLGWGKGRKAKVLSTGIDLSAHEGELVALIGPNGSGKSTLLRTLAGLMEPLAGMVELRGIPMRKFDADQRAREVACVFNEKFDTGYFSVFDIVAFGRYPYTDARNSLDAEDVGLIESALESVGMSAFARRKFLELSDGEKQKIQIARAIAQNAGVMILDEPTAFLDTPSRIEIFHLAARLVEEKNAAIVLCTHEVDLALRNAGELWVIDREHRFTAGKPGAVARSGAINRAFDTELVKFDQLVGAFKARA